MRVWKAVPRTLTVVTVASLLVTGAAHQPSVTRLDMARQSASVSAEPRTVVVDVALVAAVVESPTTIGVAESNLYTLSAQDLERQLQALKDAGVTDIRIGIPWAYIQPNSSVQYDWTKMDAVVDTVSAAGFTITASIVGNPAWDGVPIVGAPNPQAFATFAGQTAARYQGKIGAYEVWNEPNGVIFYAPVSPESYTEVLKQAYTAIKAADPDAVVVGGVLGAVRTVPGVALAPEEFLARMYSAGAGGYFDALSYHPYHYSMPFSQGLGVEHSAMEQVLALRALMVANGDADLKIWATEYGVPTTPFFGLSQSQQADFMRDFIAAWQSVDGAGPAFLYSGHDLDTGSWNNEANFGLWDENWNPKKFAAMLAEIQQQLADGTFDTSFRANGIPAAQAIFVEVASLVLGLVNTALIIPRAIGSTLYGLAEQVVATLVNAVRSTILTIQGIFAPKASVASTTSLVEEESEDVEVSASSARSAPAEEESVEGEKFAEVSEVSEVTGVSGVAEASLPEPRVELAPKVAAPELEKVAAEDIPATPAAQGNAATSAETVAATVTPPTALDPSGTEPTGVAPTAADPSGTEPSDTKPARKLPRLKRAPADEVRKADEKRAERVEAKESTDSSAGSGTAGSGDGGGSAGGDGADGGGGSDG